MFRGKFSHFLSGESCTSFYDLCTITFLALQNPDMWICGHVELKPKKHHNCCMHAIHFQLIHGHEINYDYVTNYIHFIYPYKIELICKSLLNWDIHVF